MFDTKRFIWFTGFGVLGLAAIPCLQAQYMAPTAYSVTAINSMMGTPVTMQIYRDGNRAVIDNSSGDTHVRSLYDLAAHTNLSWDLKNPSSGCGTATFSGDWGDPFISSDVDEMLKSSPKPTGSEAVNGMMAQIFEATEPKSKTKLKVWRELKTGLFVKVAMTAPGAAAATTIVEVKQFSPMKPAAAVFVAPDSCKDVKAPAKMLSTAEKLATEIGGAPGDYEDATLGPGSSTSCTMQLRMVSASMQPLTDVQVALDLAYDIDKPPSYVMGGSPSGKTVFSGGHLKEYTDQVRNGVLRVDNIPAVFDIELTFAGGNKGASSAMLYRHCGGPQGVLLFVLKNPANVSEGADWVWVKSGKYAAGGR